MAITNPWHWLYSSETIKRIPQKAGVYELGNKYKTVIYIGKASGGRLRERVSEHIGDKVNQCIRKNAEWFRYAATKAFTTEERSLFKEYKKSHHGKIPPCNIQDPSL